MKSRMFSRLGTNHCKTRLSQKYEFLHSAEYGKLEPDGGRPMFEDSRAWQAGRSVYGEQQYIRYVTVY